MFARISTFTLLALPLLATATAVLPRTDGAAGCATGPVQCCNSVQNPSNLTPFATGRLGLLGVVIGDLTANVGVTCSPITVIGVGGTSCTSQTVCCDNNTFNGLVALGCMPININV
ncbi:hydrophobin [Armillaria mellea]|nr:hydrophobin [Armillaria mellea]